MKKYDVTIIDGGPAGPAIVVAARDHGAESILILERNRRLGGILNQYIHNGFGLRTFRKELAGPEYAARYEEQMPDRGIKYRLDTMVIDINRDKVVTAMNREEGLFEIRIKAVILAIGCRERSRSALNIPGYRSAGIFPTDTAQRLVGMEGFIPDRKVVILRSGDIGLIMARCIILEGAKVKVVVELVPYSSGLKRNIVQYLNDHDIPLRLSHTMIDIQGEERLTGVTLAAVDEKGKPIPGTEEDCDCGILFLSAGLTPENGFSGSIRVKMNHVASGLIVNESLETSVEGIFTCGDMLRVHDLVDFVSEETATAEENAAGYVTEEEVDRQGHEINLKAVDGMHYIVSRIMNPQRVENAQVIRFRAGNVYKDCYIGVCLDDEQAMHGKRPVMAPGEMKEIKLEKEKLLLHPGLKTITIKVEEA